MPNFTSLFTDSPSLSIMDNIWKLNTDRSVTVVPTQMTTTLEFPQQDPGFYLDFTMNFEQWLEGYDYIVSGSTIIGLSGANIEFTFLNSPNLTCWVSGGVSGTVYPITYQIQTLEGRKFSMTAWLDCEYISPEPPIQ